MDVTGALKEETGRINPKMVTAAVSEMMENGGNWGWIG
jgi:hypothetical protein